MPKERLRINTEKVIVNLFREDNKNYITLGHLKQFIEYIHQQLAERKLLSEYQDVVFNINFDAIERTVFYNNLIFELIDDTIFLKKDLPNEITSNCHMDDNVMSIIRDFIKAA